jgi:uncharacterized membrane protein YphA (DoxX/SURF4 family)
MNVNEEKAGRQMLGQQFDRIDRRITRWMARSGVTVLRVSIGVVFVWFGALKFFPGASPAADLIRESWGFVETWGLMPMGTFITILAVWEVLIGLGFITGKFLRATILLMVLQMFGAVSPVVLQPSAVWQQFPFVLTLEGQYIVKNAVLISAAFVVGATVRGGGLADEPETTPAQVRHKLGRTPAG